MEMDEYLWPSQPALYEWPYYSQLLQDAPAPQCASAAESLTATELALEIELALERQQQ